MVIPVPLTCMTVILPNQLLGTSTYPNIDIFKTLLRKETFIKQLIDSVSSMQASKVVKKPKDADSSSGISESEDEDDEQEKKKADKLANLDKKKEDTKKTGRS